MTNDELAEALKHASSEITLLRHRLAAIESSTDLVSPSFLKRAFAVLGHYLVASLICALPIYAILLIVWIARALA